MNLALHVIILSYIDYKQINMMSNDIVNSRAQKNHLARAPQNRLKIAHFELFLESSNENFKFLVCLFPIRARAPQKSANGLMEIFPAFVACKSDLQKKIQSNLKDCTFFSKTSKSRQNRPRPLKVVFFFPKKWPIWQIGRQVQLALKL